MYWDGNRWVEDRPLDGAPTTLRPGRRRQGLLMTVAMVILAPAVLIPLWPANAATARLTVGGHAIPGATLTIAGDGFNARTWIQLEWDSSAAGLPLVRASSQGAIVTSLTVPRNAVLGTHLVRAVQSAAGMRRAESAGPALASATVMVLDPSPAVRALILDVPTLAITPNSTQPDIPAPVDTPIPATQDTPMPDSSPTLDPTPIRTDKPTLAPVPTPTADPTPTSGPTALPSLVPTAVAAPTPTPCGSLQDSIDATTPGSTLDLTGCTFTTGATIAKPLTLVGATIHVPASQKGLVVTSSGVTLDHLTILGAQSTTYNASETGVYSNGSAASPIVGLIIRNSEVGRFGQSALWLRHVSSVSVTSNTIHDTVYAGIMILSGLGGTIAHNTVQRIGVVGSGTNSGNAYGIALSDTEAPVTSGITVSGNSVADVPTWHAFDTHGGRSLSFTNNTVMRCSRGIFITTDNLGNRATDVLVQGNNLGSPAPVTFNLSAVTTYDADQTTITDNFWSAGWSGNYFEDYQAQSTNLVVSNNTVN